MPILYEELFEERDRAIAREVERIRSNAAQRDDEQLDLEEAEVTNQMGSGIGTLAEQGGEYINGNMFNRYELSPVVPGETEPYGDYYKRYMIQEDQITGSNFLDRHYANSSELRTQDIKYATEQGNKLMQADFALKQRFERFAHRNDPEISAKDANAYLKERGVDVTFDRSVSKFEIEQAVKSYHEKQAWENALYRVRSTGSISALQEASVFGASLMSSVGPIEFASTVALGWAVPEAGVSVLARGAGAIRNTMLAKKSFKTVADARKLVRKASTVNTVAKANTKLATEVEEQVASNFLKSQEAAEKAKEIEENLLKWTKRLENIEALKYSNLTGKGKLVGDALAYTASDVPFALQNYYNSQELGVDLVTAKDVAYDLGFAGFMGIALPAGFRKIGDLLHISPIELQIRKGEELMRDLDQAEALGKITKEQADAAREPLTKIVEASKELKNQYKSSPNPRYVKDMDELKRTNMDDSEYEALYAQLESAILAGTDPRELPTVSSIPGFKKLMSNVDATALERLVTENASAKEVFGNALDISVDANGFYRVKVLGETGLLGRFSVVGTNEEEALYWLKELYKGFVVLDKEGNASREAFKSYALSVRQFSEDLNSIHNQYLKEYASNNRIKEGTPQKGDKFRGADELINLKEALRSAFLRFKIGQEGLDRYDLFTAKKDLAAIQKQSITDEEFAPVLAEYEKFYAKHVLESENKNGKTLYDFRNKEGDKNKIADDSAKAKETYFKHYLNELEKATGDLDELANTDNFFREMTASQVDEIKEAFQSFKVSENTTLDKLFGVQRLSSDELAETYGNHAFWAATAARKTIQKMQSIGSNDALSKAEKALKAFSSVDDIHKSNFDMNSQFLKAYEEYVKEQGFNDIMKAVVLKMQEHPDFQDAISKIAETGEVPRGIEKTFRDVLLKSLDDKNITKSLTPKKIQELVTGTTSRFVKLLKEDPELLEVFKPINKDSEDQLAKALDDVAGTKDQIKVGKESVEIKTEASGGRTPKERLAEAVKEAYKELRESLGAVINKLNTTVPDNPKVAQQYRKALNRLKKISKANDDLDPKDLDEIPDNLKKEFMDAYEDVQVKAQKAHSLKIALESGVIPEEFSAEVKKAPEPKPGVDQAKVAEYVKAKMRLNKLFKSVSMSLEIELNRLVIQANHDMEIATDFVSLMAANPAYASEILTGAATQTVYNFLGSKRSVEYMSKTYGYYANDLRNRLNKMSAQTASGQTLLQYMENDRNRPEILECLVKIKHGEDLGQANSDAARVAKEILDQESSFAGGFLQFGSDYRAPMQFVKRSNLKYADAKITEADVSRLYNIVAKATTIDGDILRASMPTDEKGLVKSGEFMVKSTDKPVVEKTDAYLKDIASTLDRIKLLDNVVHRNLALWALEDFDLDSMFDPSFNSHFGLNKVRDALLSGDLVSLVNGDLYNLRYIAEDLKRIETALVGKEIKVIGDKTYASLDSWVSNFQSGFRDTSAVISGKKVAAFDSFEAGIRFKNASSELKAVHLFGHDSMKDYIEETFHQMFQAYYTVERFGTRPLEIISECIDTYNQAIRSSDHYAGDMLQIYAETRGNVRGVYEKFSISENAKKSIIQNVMLACGLQNSAPSMATRVIKALVRIVSSPMLMAAGFKSFSDYSTIMEGLMLNSMAEGRIAALARATKATKLILENKDIRHLFLATNIIEGDNLLKQMYNDPGVNIVDVSAGSTWVDKLEDTSKKVADGLLNTYGRMGYLTNNNKMVAGYCIQQAIGENASKSFDELSDVYKQSLQRGGVTAEDWEFMRKNLVHDLTDYVNKQLPEGSRKLQGEDVKLFIPLSASEISDDVIRAELLKRGMKQVSSLDVDSFRNRMATTAWNMVDTSADEMVSMPSSRIGNIMRAGFAPGSGIGALFEIITQFQSFGAAICYNTYGRTLAKYLDGEVGVSVLDLFNPLVKLKRHNRWEIFAVGLLPAVFNVTMGTMLVSNIVGAMQGVITNPFHEEGRGDFWFNSTSGLFSGMGSVGMIIDMCYTGFEGSGQRGGGLSVQVAPSVSNFLRTGYRIRQPIVSEKIPEYKKPQAVAAATAQNALRYTGMTTLPIVGPLYQALMGSWLDMHVKGGYANYREAIRAKQRRGRVLMPWEEDPRPFWERPVEDYPGWIGLQGAT